MLGAAAAVCVVPFPALGCRMLPGNSIERYAAWSAGKRIGELQFRFERDDGAFIVSARMRLSPMDLSGDAGAVEFQARETWRGAELKELDSSTLTLGLVREVSGRRVRNGFRVLSDYFAHPLMISGYFVTSTLWHRDARLVAGFLDVQDGRFKRASVTPGVVETVKARGRDVRAQRYSYRGELNREAWFDDDCVLVHMKLLARNNTIVSFELEV